MYPVTKRAAVSTIIALAVGASIILAQDRAKVVPGMKVLLENDCVRVQYHDVAVGQTVPMHSHPHYVVYPLKAYKVRVKLQDGSESISEHKAGDVHWNEATVHSIENIGDSDVHNLVIELKPAGSCH
jgi:quercetin dioxygenase-like cupin family protein